ncbi:MAG TPA: DUF2231 domain-containing protein [Balneolaceae bacterium]|nr:DUF2231 domain-containing protein [Balneolaceae bacterium]
MNFILFQIPPDWAPNIHPMLVHFPIAILAVAIFFDFVSFFLPNEKKWWTEEATAFLYGVGAVAAIIIYYTGILAANSVDASEQAEAVMRIHRSWAWWTVWFYGIYAILRIIATWWSTERHRVKFHIGFFLVSFIGMYFLYQTGEHGAKMVYGYGLGTGQLIPKTKQTQQTPKQGYKSEEDGTVSWLIGKGAVNTLNDHFTFVQGSPNTAIDSDGDKQMLDFQNPDLFMRTNNSSYSNMQMKLMIDPDQYKGIISIVHNVHDAQNYAYMILHADGSAELGRVRDGQKTTIEEAGQHSFDWEKMKILKLSVNGDHIKGYVNGQQILHGHSDQTGPGSLGLKLNGQGTLGLTRMEVAPIAAEEDHDH